MSGVAARLTRTELLRQLRALKERERHRTAAARAAALAKRQAERPKLARQVRGLAVEGKSQRWIVRELHSYGWRVSRNTVAAILGSP